METHYLSWHPRWIVCKNVFCWVSRHKSSVTNRYMGGGAREFSLSFESQLAEETPRLTGTRWGNLSFVCLCTDGIMGKKKNWLMLSSQTLAQPSNRIYIYLFSFFFLFFSFQIHEIFMGLQTGSYTFDMFTILTPGSVCLSRPDVNRDTEELRGSRKSTFGKFNASFQLKQWIKYFT